MLYPFFGIPAGGTQLQVATYLQLGCPTYGVALSAGVLTEVVLQNLPGGVVNFYLNGVLVSQCVGPATTVAPR